MYAIISAGGKQHRVEAGELLAIDYIKNKKQGDSIIFEDVLMLKNDAGYQIGKPLVAGAKVEATIVDNGDEGGGVKAKKVHVFRKRRRHGYKKLNGFRALSTRIKIDNITA